MECLCCKVPLDVKHRVELVKGIKVENGIVPMNAALNLQGGTNHGQDSNFPQFAMVVIERRVESARRTRHCV